MKENYKPCPLKSGRNQERKSGNLITGTQS